jgi:putative ABC transport system permease protein
MDLLAARLTKTYPGDYPPQQRWSLRLQDARASLTGAARPTLALLFVAACFVLLVVCVNVASLLLARSTVRTREFAVRQAIGASAGRLARQVLTESMLLSLGGGVLAVVVLKTLPGRLLALVPGDVPRITEFHVDWRLAAVGLLLALGAGILFGASPAWRAASISPIRDLNEGGRSGGAYGMRQRRVRATLVAVEVALSVVLLVGAGLLLRSFVAVLHENPGIEPNGLLTGQIWIPYPNDPKANRYLTPIQRAALVRRLLDRLARLPGVSRVAIASSADIPFAAALAGTEGPFSFVDEGETRAGDHAAVFGTVTAQYFSVLGTPIEHGRDLTPHDDLNAPAVALVNEAFVKRFSAQRDPIGRTIRGPRGAAYQIVGVVADIHESGRDAPTIPHVYLSMLQSPTQVLAVFLRTRSEADAMRRQLVGAVREVEPELPVFAVRSMNEVMSGSIARRRFVLSMVTAFAASALLLAAMGLYGVVSFLVAHRTQEFGIRLALGATPRSIAMLAARPGLTLTGAGTLLGLGLSFVAARLLSTLMFGVAANDAVTFAGVAVLLFLVAIVASLVPARRATRVSPMDALRS